MKLLYSILENQHFYSTFNDALLMFILSIGGVHLCVFKNILLPRVTTNLLVDMGTFCLDSFHIICIVHTILFIDLNSEIACFITTHD